MLRGEIELCTRPIRKYIFFLVLIPSIALSFLEDFCTVHLRYNKKKKSVFSHTCQSARLKKCQLACILRSHQCFPCRVCSTTVYVRLGTPKIDIKETRPLQNSLLLTNTRLLSLTRTTFAGHISKQACGFLGNLRLVLLIGRVNGPLY